MNFRKIERGICVNEFKKRGSCERGESCMFTHEIPDDLKKDKYIIKDVEYSAERIEKKKKEKEKEANINKSNGWSTQDKNQYHDGNKRTAKELKQLPKDHEQPTKGKRPEKRMENKSNAGKHVQQEKEEKPYRRSHEQRSFSSYEGRTSRETAGSKGPKSKTRKKEINTTRKRIRRGIKKTERNISMYYNNINGMSSKRESLCEIMKNLQPNIVCLCETKLANLNTVKKTLPDYNSIGRCSKLGKGGLIIAVKQNTFSSFLDITTTPSNNILVGRVTIGDYPIRIILGYAPQENASTDIREEFYTEIAIEVQNGLLAGEGLLITGDFNAKIESCPDKEGNKHINPVTRNGSILCDLIKEYKLNVINLSEICSGKWTHVIRTNGEQSALDYVMADNQLKTKITELIIDESTIFCPFHTQTKNKNKRTIFSDHNAMVLKLQIQNVQKGNTKMKDKGQDKWKLTTDGIAQIETNVKDVYKKKRLKEHSNTQDKYDELENCIKQVMNKCFEQRKTPQSRNQEEKLHPEYERISKIINKYSSKGRIQRKVAKMYRDKILDLNANLVSERKSKTFKKALNQLTLGENFSAQCFWKLRRSTKKNQQTCTSIVTKEGKEVFGTSGIIDTYKEEFMQRLKHAEVAPEMHTLKKKTELLCNLAIRDSRNTKETLFTMKEVSEVIKALKTGKSTGPDQIPAEIFISGGERLTEHLLNVVNDIKETHDTPQQWNNVGITTIYKHKGKVKELVNHRGIFLTAVASKIFERLIMKRIQSTTESMSMFQAGSRKNRSTADQTFILRSLISHCKYMGTTLYLTLYDFKQCFDNLWLEDSLVSLWKLGLKTEMLSLIYKLNEKANITVKTPLGITETFSMHGIAKQGTVLIPPICSASVGECCEEHYKGGASIGSVSIRSLAFVDDLMDINSNISDVKAAHETVTFFSKKKNMPLNEKKCIILIINGKPPNAIPILLVNGKRMGNEEKVKYLGDVFNTKGSNTDLIKDRVDKGIRCMVNSICECNDITKGNFAIQTLMLLYKTLFVPTVIFNSESWHDLNKQDIEKINKVQLKFLKRILHTPTSTPNVIVYLELGVIPIEQEIHVRQLSFLHHILSLNEKDPVKEIYYEQKKYPHEKNWYNEVTELLLKYRIEYTEAEIKQMNKNKWKNIIKQQVTAETLKHLNSIRVTQSKASKLPQYEYLQLQKYFTFLNSEDARILFQLRSEVYDIKTFRKYMYTDLRCRLCNLQNEDINHIINECDEIQRTTDNVDTYSLNEKRVTEVITRIKQFTGKVNEIKNLQHTQELCGVTV